MSVQDKFDRHVPPHGPGQRIGSLLLLGVVILIIGSILMGSWYTVDQGERARQSSPPLAWRGTSPYW